MINESLIQNQTLTYSTGKIDKTYPNSQNSKMKSTIWPRTQRDW